MGFHNPYMETPDWGSGISDFKNKILMLIMAMNGMPGGGGESSSMSSLGETMPGLGRHGMSMMAGAQPQPGSMPPTGGPPMTGPMVQGGAPSSFPPTGGPPTQTQLPTQMPQMDPQMLMMIMKMMQGRQ